MGVRDAIVLNTTGSNFEAIQSNDTVRIKGDNSELLSLRNDSGTTIFKVDTSDSSVTMTGDITGSANLSGSATTSGSFGRFDGTLFVGDGNDSTLRATLPRSAGTVTGSAQMAGDISGSFTSGFNYEGTISGCTVTAGGTWSAGGALSCAQTYAAVAGDKNASILAMGTPSTWPAPSIVGSVDNNEEYNGTSWSEANNNNTARYRSAAAGTQTDSVFFGGVLTPPANPAWYGISTGATETYNGTNFSEVNDMIIPRRAHMGAGLTGNAALAIGGYDDSGFGPQNPSATPTMDENVEVWNGTNWADDGQVPVSVRRGAAAGSTESAIVFGTNLNKTETYEWNGSSWSEGGTNHQSRQDVGGGGTQNDAISFGGWPTNNVGTCAQNYDGTTWSITGALINNRSRGGMGANQGKASTAHRAGGGASPGSYAACGETEEYTGGVGGTVSFGDIKATTLKGDATNISSSLYIGSTVVSGSSQIAPDVSGSFTSGFEFSGAISGSVNSSGSFGRVVADFFTGDACFISTSISIGDNIISGSAQLAADISGAFDSGFEYSGSIEVKPSEWDSWATHASMITGRAGLGGKGSRTAAIAVAGTGNYAAPHSEADQMGHYFYSGVELTCTEEWNGTSWSEVNDTIRGGLSGYGGTTEAGYSMGKNPIGVASKTEEWNGTNWSEGPDINAGSAGWNSDAGGCAPNTMYIIGGNGSNGQPYFTTFDGSSFTAEPNMPNVYHYGRNGHSGNASSALAWGSSCYKNYSDCTISWDGSSWTEVSPLPILTDRGTGAGTVNDSYAYGGRCATEGGPTYATNQVDTFLFWNGSTWTAKGNIPTPYEPSLAYPTYGRGHHEPIGVGSGTSDIFIYGGREWITGNDTMAASASLMYNEYTAAGSFGRVVANTLVGNAINLSSSFFTGTGTVSSSAQIASDVSGSFTSGFEFSGTISGSSASTGSFARLDATTFEADATNIASEFFAGCGVLSGSSAGEISSDISGSFISGFGYEGNIGAAFGGVFSIGADMGRRARFLGGLGSPSSALAIGGHNVNTAEALTEEYDGSSWSEGGELPAAHAGMGTAGTQNAGFIAGGFPSSEVGNKALDYNGSSWSETTDLPATNLDHTIGAGVSANSAFMGITPSYSPTDCRTGDWYVWNGSNWSEESANLNNSRYRANGGGESTEAALVTGGDAHVASCACSELWDGSSWSNTSALITGNRWGTFAGTTSDAIVIGGYPSVHLETTAQLWDGTTWTETSKLISGTTYGGGGHGAAASGRVGVGTLAGGAHKFGGGVFSTPASELFSAFVNSGSFGRIDATSIIGDGTGIADALISGCGIVSSSAQIAGDISGSFTGGFGYSGSLLSTSGDIITNGGFDADSDWTQKETGWSISGGKAVASNVGYSYTISQNVSEVQTGVSQEFRLSFTISDYTTGAVGWIIGTQYPIGAVSSSGTHTLTTTKTPASQKIGLLGASGSFNGKIDNVIVEILNSGTTGSFGSVRTDKLHGNFINFSQSFVEAKVPVSSSAQIADQISGSFIRGLSYEGSISGSYDSTGSFGRVGNFERSELIRYVGSAPNWSTIVPRSAGIISSSGQIADDISGSFTSGIGYTGNVQTGIATADGTWSAGGAMSQAKAYGMGTGDKSAALAVGGAPAVWPAPAVGNADVGRTEQYDGTSWSEAPDNVTARNFGSATGTQNDALIIGGFLPPAWYGVSTGATETYDGTSFSEVNDLNQARRATTGAGLSTNSSLAYGGYQDSAPVNPGFSPIMQRMTEEWNGTNWSEVNDLPASVRRGVGGGTVNAAIWYGGRGTAVGSTFHYNGTNWATGGSGHRAECNVDGGGAQDDAISAGSSYNTYTATTQIYDGTTWSAANDRINAIGDGAVGVNQGKASTAILFGGDGPTYVPYAAKTCTEEWNGGAGGTFSAGLVSADNLRGDATGFSGSLDFAGTVSSSNQIAGDISGSFATGMEFSTNSVISASVVTSQDDIATYLSGSLVGTQGSVRVGGTWSTGNNVPTGKNSAMHWGTKHGSILAGGANTGTNTQEYNGSNWSEVGTMIQGAHAAGAFGGSTESGLVAGGFNPARDCTQIWNGTNWSFATDLLKAGGFYNSGGKSVDAGIIFNGYPAACAQEWDGCTWKSIANPNESAIRNAGTGESPTAAMVAGADPTPSPMGCRVQIWDGTSWSYVNRLSVGRRYQGAAGTTNDAIMIGGHSLQPHLPDSVKNYTNAPSGHNLTEIWNGNTWSETGNLPGIQSYVKGTGGNGGTDTAMIAGGVTPSTATYEFSNHASSGSFAHFEVQHKGEVEVERFSITGSTFQLPSFSDRDLNFQSLESQESTGSMSGSVVREADVKSQLQAGEFFFHSDYNALSFTYLSQSVYSQSFSFVSQSFYTGSESVWTSSIGMVTQSFYSQSVNIRYITGSQV